MTFPVEFHIFGKSLPAHTVFETLGYVVGFQTYLLLRRRDSEARLPSEQLVWILVGAIFGALVGSKVLAWLESAREYWAHRDQLSAMLGGKTIVGGLLGGWIGVEIAKRALGISRRTGDAFVVPLCVGIAVGRIGCFLAGLPDHTHGTATALPFAVDFGDGVGRHPTQLYESCFVILLGVAMVVSSSRLRRPGDRFRWFMMCYLTFRFLVEFIKPSDKPLLGLSMIQLASLAGVVFAATSLRKIEKTGLQVS